MPKGIGLTSNLSNPFPPSYDGVGIYCHDDGVNKKLVIRDEDNNIIPVQDIAEQVGGNSQNFSRTMTNMSGITIPAGKAVYISAPGQISLADSTGSTTSVFFGITKTSIPNGQQGDVIYSGVAPGVFLVPITGYIWLDTTAGELIDSPPQNPGESQVIVGLADGLDLIIQPQLLGTVQ